LDLRSSYSPGGIQRVVGKTKQRGEVGPDPFEPYAGTEGQFACEPVEPVADEVIAGAREKALIASIRIIETDGARSGL
jgi:hypothetical protein